MPIEYSVVKDDNKVPTAYERVIGNTPLSVVHITMSQPSPLDGLHNFNLYHVNRDWLDGPSVYWTDRKGIVQSRYQRHLPEKVKKKFKTVVVPYSISKLPVKPRFASLEDFLEELPDLQNFYSGDILIVTYLINAINEVHLATSNRSDQVFSIDMIQFSKPNT